MMVVARFVMSSPPPSLDEDDDAEGFVCGGVSVVMPATGILSELASSASSRSLSERRRRSSFFAILFRILLLFFMTLLRYIAFVSHNRTTARLHKLAVALLSPSLQVLVGQADEVLHGAATATAVGEDVVTDTWMIIVVAVL